VLAIVGWRVARKSAARNQRAFDDELPVLLTRGFVEAQHSLPAGVTISGRVRRLLYRGGQARVWLSRARAWPSAINSLPPTRYAVIQFDRPVPTGQLTQSRHGVSGPAGGVVSTFGASGDELAFVQTLRHIVDPLLPESDRRSRGDQRGTSQCSSCEGNRLLTSADLVRRPRRRGHHARRHTLGGSPLIRNAPENCADQGVSLGQIVSEGRLAQQRHRPFGRRCTSDDGRRDHPGTPAAGPVSITVSRTCRRPILERRAVLRSVHNRDQGDIA
jgi:hypothetical protein